MRSRTTRVYGESAPRSAAVIPVWRNEQPDGSTLVFGRIPPLFIRLYARTPEKWQCSVGKLCVLDGDTMKRALPATRKHFW